MLSEYEQQRCSNIRRNKEKLKQLGLDGGSLLGSTTTTTVNEAAAVNQPAADNQPATDNQPAAKESRLPMFLGEHGSSELDLLFLLGGGVHPGWQPRNVATGRRGRATSLPGLPPPHFGD